MILIRRIAIAYLLLVAVLTCLSFVAYTIPFDKVADNVAKSEEIILSENARPWRIAFLKQDYFTDGLMLDVAVSGIGPYDDGLTNALLNPLLRPINDDTASAGKKVALGIDEDDNYTHYGRYWHGYLFPLRILLCMTDLSGIRILNCILLWTLLFLNFLLLKKKIGLAPAVAFLACVGGIGLPPVAMSLQFSGCFYIMLLGVLFFATVPKLSSDLASIGCAMFVIGAVTSWVDLLTAPLLTLGIPLAVALMLNRNLKHKCNVAFKCILCWALGYALIWASKWLLASVATDINVLENALGQLKYRMIGETAPGSYIYRYLICVFSFGSLIFAAILCSLKRFKPQFREYGYLILIGLLPAVWFLVVYNHSVIHLWFAWRAAIVLLFCWSCFFIKCWPANHYYNK